MHSRTSAVAIIGSLAISSALLLGGCGGNSTAGATSAAASSAAVAAPASAAAVAAAVAAAASAAATSAGPVAATDWNPPRPTGISDADWARYGKDPATLTPQQLEKSCSENKPATPEQVDSITDMYVGSTAEEWTAYADYYMAFYTQLCANTPEPAAVLYEAAGACDPEKYAYCITPDMDGQTIELQYPDLAFIDIAGVLVNCEGTGYAAMVGAAGLDGGYNWAAIGTNESQGLAGDTVCTVTGQADGATVMTLNVTVLDPA